jgi:hypothetical protein
MRQVALTRRGVLNPEMVFDYSDLYPYFNLGTDYLVITDNQHWNAQTMSPTGAAGGDLVASFERLAAWKRQRGLKARVVTISEIVADNYGNFRTGSRDLQEVIRKFLKMAQADWGVAWVLLGGDASIVPVRWAAGSREGGVDRGYQPASRQHHSGPAATCACTPDAGLVCGRDHQPAGAARHRPADPMTRRGANATRGSTSTDDTYATPRQPERFCARQRPGQPGQRGPAIPVHRNRSPPTCIIPACWGQPQPAGAARLDPSRHGVYGQHSAASELDGINYATVAWAAPRGHGRAGGCLREQVIAYEVRATSGTPLENAWARRIVLASRTGAAGWGSERPQQRPATTSTTTAGEPQPDQAEGHTRLGLVPARSGQRDRRETLPTARTPRRRAGAVLRRSSRALSPNILWFIWSERCWPAPASQWIAVYGGAELRPAVISSTRRSSAARWPTDSSGCRCGARCRLQ